MASNAAAPFWRSAGMTYITYSNLCANLFRNCLKEPYKSEALTREKVHYSVSKWVDGKPQKPSNASIKKEVKLGNFESRLNLSVHSKHYSQESLASPYKVSRSCLSQDATMVPNFPRRFLTTGATSVDKVPEDASSSLATPRIKFKRLDKTAAHIMQILDKEAVEEVKARCPIPDIKPGYIIQLKVEVPENKRRVSIVKGIVIARRNAGLNSTFRLRRLVAGVGVENLFHLYSPNIKEMKVLDKKKVRRAKLYYLRDKMNALKKH